jgi:hypothetical protein
MRKQETGQRLRDGFMQEIQSVGKKAAWQTRHARVQAATGMSWPGRQRCCGDVPAFHLSLPGGIDAGFYWPFANAVVYLRTKTN